MIDLRISPEQVELLGFVEHGSRKTAAGDEDLNKRPLFQALKSPTGVMVRDRSYQLLGVVRRKNGDPEKRLLVMVRCDVLD